MPDIEQQLFGHMELRTGHNGLKLGGELLVRQVFKAWAKEETTTTLHNTEFSLQSDYRQLINRCVTVRVFVPNRSVQDVQFTM